MRRSRPLSLVPAAFTVLVIGACGPGTGGTGSGGGAAGTAADHSLATFGAAPASVCAGPLAIVLDCGQASSAAPGATPTPVPDPLVPGPAQPGSWFADSPTRATVQALFVDQGATVTWPCTGVRFEGRFGVVGTQPPRFYGRALAPAFNGAAILDAAVASGNAGLVLTLRDAGGGVLVMPATVSRQAGPADGTGCAS